MRNSKETNRLLYKVLSSNISTHAKNSTHTTIRKERKINVHLKIWQHLGGLKHKQLRSFQKLVTILFNFF